MPTASTRYDPPTSASDLARRTATGVFVAVLGLLLVAVAVDVAGVDVGPTGEESPFAAVPLVATTVVAGAAAAVAYAAVARFTDRPDRNFVLLSAGVFAVMLVPVLAFAPSLDVTVAGQVVLVAFHVVAAVPIVALVTGVIRV